MNIIPTYNSNFIYYTSPSPPVERAGGEVSIPNDFN